MADDELVTLEAPDGRRIRTDSRAEIVTLTTAHGYRKVTDDADPQPTPPHSPSPAHEPDTHPVSPSTRVDEPAEDTDPETHDAPETDDE